MMKYWHWSGVASLTGEDNTGVIHSLLSLGSRSHSKDCNSHIFSCYLFCLIFVLYYQKDCNYLAYFLVISFVLSLNWAVLNVLDMFLFSFISCKATSTQL